MYTVDDGYPNACADVDSVVPELPTPVETFNVVFEGALTVRYEAESPTSPLTNTHGVSLVPILFNSSVGPPHGSHPAGSGGDVGFAVDAGVGNAAGGGGVVGVVSANAVVVIWTAMNAADIASSNGR